MSAAPPQPAIDFSVRFGKPRIRRYKADDRIRLSVEYRADGTVSALEIAPVAYRGCSSSQPVELLSETADKILEELVPGITASAEASEIAVRKSHPGFVREQRRLRGTVLNRDYPLGEDRSKMIAASLTISTSDLGENLSKVISGFGAPEYEQFSAESGLAIAVLYGTETLFQHVSISASEPLLVHSDYGSPINPVIAEALLDEILPPTLRRGEPRKSLFISGAYRRALLMYEHLSISRIHTNDDLMNIGIAWPVAGDEGKAAFNASDFVSGSDPNN